MLGALLAIAAAVSLPGLSYEIFGSGPGSSQHPTRADTVEVRYTGRLTDGAVFSASPESGTGLSSFEVQRVIPGFMAALLLMRPGDKWRVTLPSYLAYGATGRAMGPQASAMQSRDIPPNATLIFDIELVAIRPAKP